ncbi:alcohol dehydrogenase catalytic domain-containing protein [Micromonospora purpureochromogenes]|uniref:alcohol dehydrogenase catalytic domain-containing protein n=1 Tax=Micromonospora purpureochromogenes TaxID=47872 RepID=UPI0033DB7DBF
MADGDVPEQMQAAAFDEFGGPEVITPRILPVPQIADDEVLIKVWSAGVGVWDALTREGALVPEGSTFPIVPGAEAAGSVAAVGRQVTNVAVGDVIYVYGYTRPKGGFYAEYARTGTAGIANSPGGG